MKKGRHPAELLGLLGLLGLIGLWDPRFSWLGVFGVAPVLVRFRPDERFQWNLARAGRDTFFVSVISLVVLNGVGMWRPEWLLDGVRALLLLVLFQFVLTVLYYEWRGQ